MTAPMTTPTPGNLNELRRLAELAEIFRFAVEAHMDANPILAFRVQTTITETEFQEMMDLSAIMTTEGMKAFLGEDVDAEECLRHDLQLSEKAAELALRVIDEDELRGALPEELRNAESATALATTNAPCLARLAAPKPL